MILHLARREWLEQRRHPLMLGICGVLLVLIAGLVVSLLGLLQLVANDPLALDAVGSMVPGADPTATLGSAVELTLSAFGFLIYSQYLGFVGVIAGHSVLHDRTHGTLPFLLLAPLRRLPLLAGKVLGAVGPLTVLFWGISAIAGGIVAGLPISAAHADLSPRTASWWIALLLAGPAWAAFVATVSAVISAIARDVRLAQQGVWFVVFFVQLVVAFLITGSLGSSSAQLLAAALGAVCAGTSLVLGARVLSRDLGR